MFNKLKNNRFILLGVFFCVFILTHRFFEGSFLPSTETKDLWFYSGIFMILFSILFIEPYYTSPKNVITNTIPLLIVFLSIKNSFEHPSSWLIAFWIILALLIISVVAMILEDKNKSQKYWKNKIAEVLKKTAMFFGQGKRIYSGVFLLFLFENVLSKNTDKISEAYFIVLIVLWGLILSINTSELVNTFSINKRKRNEDEIGEIFGVQSRKIFLVKLFDDRKGISKFDIVRFRYSMQESNDFLMSGIVFDTYLLNQEKWAKILQLGRIARNDVSSEKNVVYKVFNKEEISTLEKELHADNFVGIVIEGSSIGKIKFEYSKKQDDLQEGDLIELKTNDRRLFYQVVNGVTEKESLEQRNETGFIMGEAIQLGEWINNDLSFQKYGWVPSINTPIFKADTSDIKVKSFKYPEYKLGIIPNTSLPSVINLAHAVSHHMALLGVTGSGKSFLAREIINQLKQDTKVICIDFTGEWEKELNKYNIKNTLLGGGNINNFLDNDEGKVGIVGLSAMSNTSEVIQQTEKLFETIFNFAKEKYNKNTPIKISLVLEEAHTITPETSFLGDLGDYGANKALVNKMSQVALQGRKYGVGMLIIAQRTANVSKTVLTQCNTVICFQAFDETSFNFLGNYVGKDLVLTLPNLKQYHAIVTGKAIKSNVPMIIDLKR
jgi:hypothetical protein